MTGRFSVGKLAVQEGLMRVFVIGPSASGKTPFCTRLMERLGLGYVSASERYRSAFPPESAFPDRQAFTDAITRFSLDELRRDPETNVAFLRRKYGNADGAIVDSVRNPHDFVHLFDPRTDAAVFLERVGNPVRPTSLESGVGVIDAYLQWLIGNGLLEGARVFRFVLHHAAHIEACADRVAAALEPARRAE